MKRLALISFLLAALVHSGRAQAQPERPDHVVFEYAVFWPSSPKNPPLSVLKEVGAKRHPELRFVAAEEQAPADIAVFARVLDTKTYPPPSPAVIKSRGRGIRPSVVAKVGKSPSVLVVRTSCRRGDVGKALRSVAHLLEYVARRSRAWVWDAATRELFTAGQWKKLRTTGWFEGYPRVDRECVVDVEVVDGVHRAVSRGMAKFGQPDVVVGAFAAIHREVAERLIALTCQGLLESGGPWPERSMKLDIDALEHLEVRDALLEALGSNASRKAIVGVRRATRLESDPENALLELQFEGAPGVSLPERQESLFTHLFGEPRRARGKPTPREAEKIASKLARRRLFREIKPRYRGGVPDGETLLVKVPFRNTKGQDEYLWVEVERWDVSRVHGVLMNAPRHIPSMREGQKLAVPDAKLFDYKWYRADGSVEGNTTETARDNKKKR